MPQERTYLKEEKRALMMRVKQLKTVSKLKTNLIRLAVAKRQRSNSTLRCFTKLQRKL